MRENMCTEQENRSSAQSTWLGGLGAISTPIWATCAMKKYLRSIGGLFLVAPRQYMPGIVDFSVLNCFFCVMKYLFRNSWDVPNPYEGVSDPDPWFHGM
jgi:hypothetical protein